MSVARIPGKRVPEELISTGVAGLDDVLGGGLTTGRLYLIEGELLMQTKSYQAGSELM